jgi:putative phosphonate metabolism protein
MPRYALYYAPRPDEEIARFAARWLGRDPEADAGLAQPAISGVAPVRLREITASPRRYGFHGTLKPPFELARSATIEAVLVLAADFALRRAPFQVPGAALRAIDGFLALVPEPSARLDALAADCVEEFDRFRAAPDPAELERRRQAGLSPRQDELLMRWGYPYVMDEFRFHLTLTERLEAAERESVQSALAPLVAPFCGAALAIRDLVVFVQDSREAPFRVLARFPFRDNRR